MKRNGILLIAFMLITMALKAQHEKVEFGESCYYEEVNSIVAKNDFKPYTYHSRLELKFDSGYQITIKEDDKAKFLAIIDRFDEFDKKSNEDNNNSPQLIDNYSPETISFSKKVIDPNKLIKIYYCKELRETNNKNGNLIIKIPELEDMFGGASAPEKYLYFSRECILELQNILKEN
jgi:hypothetical protein